MNLTLTVKPEALRGAIPADDVLADAAAQGMEVCVRRHLRKKNQSTKPNRHGIPKSNYYEDAASTVRGSHSGGKATVEVGPDDDTGPGSGIALHYHGGTVYPKKKALAIPINPSVAGVWPSQVNDVSDSTAMIWPKNSSHGFIKDTETNELLWLLVPKATIPADKTVLPEESEILGAAERAVIPLLEAS